MAIPNDPIILLSYVNTKLRDFYDSLDEFCAAEGVEKKALTTRLATVGYIYNRELNKFI